MTDELKINGRAIYTTKGAAREYGRIGCNFYTGRPHNCSYCYLKRGAPSKQLGGTQAEQKKFIGNAVEVNMSRVLCEALARKLMDKAA